MADGGDTLTVLDELNDPSRPRGPLRRGRGRHVQLAEESGYSRLAITMLHTVNFKSIRQIPGGWKK